MKEGNSETTVQAIILCSSDAAVQKIVRTCRIYLKIKEHQKTHKVMEAKVNMKTSRLSVSAIRI